MKACDNHNAEEVATPEGVFCDCAWTWEGAAKHESKCKLGHLLAEVGALRAGVPLAIAIEPELDL